MSWRYDHFTDDSGLLVEAHVVPEPEEADGWDGFEDKRPRQFAHWHERSEDHLREFYEIPEAYARRVIEAAGGTDDDLSFHDALAILLLRLDA